MSNDTNYRIAVNGDKMQINALLCYLDQKLLRWEAWKEKHKLDDPRKRHKAFKYALKKWFFETR